MFNQTTIFFLCFLPHTVVFTTTVFYKDSPTSKLSAKKSTNLLQIQFRFTSDSIQIQFRFSSDSVQIQFRF
ncbi:hypothetical protein ACN38_g844, partial [Penicillium nordicum]